MSFGVYAQAVHKDEYRAKKVATLTDAVSVAAKDVDSPAALR